MSSVIGEAAIRVRPDTSSFQGETESQLSSTVKHIVGALAAAFAGKKIFDFGKQAVEEAAIVQKSTETIRANFGKSAQSVLDFGKSAADAYGISNEASTAFSAAIGITAQNIHLTAAQAAQMDIGFQQLAGSISAIKGEDPTLVFNTLQTALLGNTRGLKALGIEINTTSEKQAALRLGIKGSSTDWTNAQKALIIYNAAMQNASKFQEQAKQHSSDLADASIRLHAQFANLKEEIGAALLPVIARLAGFLADKLPGAMRAVEAALVPVRQKLKSFADFIATIAAQPSLELKIGVAFTGIESAVGDLYNSLKKALIGTAGHFVAIPARNVVEFKSGEPGIAAQFKASMTAAFKSINFSAIGKQVGAGIGKSITFGQNAAETIVLNFSKAILANKDTIAQVGLTLVLSMITTLLDPSFWIANWKAVAIIAINALLLAFAPEEIVGRLALAFAKFVPGGEIFFAAFLKLGTILRGLLEGLFFILRDGIEKGLGEASPVILEKVTALAGDIIGGLRSLPGKAADVFTSLGAAVRAVVVDWIATVVRLYIRVGELIIGAVKSIPGRLVVIFIAAAVGVISQLASLLTRAQAAATRIAVAILSAIGNGLKNVAGVVASHLGGIATAIFGVAKQAAGWAYNIGRDIVTGIISGIVNNAKSIATAAASAAKSALDWAKSHVGSTAAEYAARQLGVPMMQGVSAGIVSEQATLAQTFAGALKGAIDKVAATATTQAAAPLPGQQPGAAPVGGIHIENVNVSADRPEMFLRELNLVAMRATL